MRRGAAVLLAAAGVGAGRAQAPPGLDSYIKGQMKVGLMGGVSAAVVQNDQILWANAYGSTKPGTNGNAVGNDTAFMFASLSKTNIAVAAMILKDKGWLDVDDDVNKYLPFKLRNPAYESEPITVHHLLTHTSSINDDSYDDMAIYMPPTTGADPTISLKDFLEGYLVSGGRWYSKKDSFHAKYGPGKKFDYSNVGACAAAYICELIAQQHSFAADFDDLVRTHIYAPLGVDITGGHVGYFVRDFPTLAPPAGAFPSVGALGVWQHCQQYAVPDYPTCDWRSSATDYAKMFGMFINKGTFQGKQVLKPETVEYMQKKNPDVKGGDESVSNVLWLYEKDQVPGYKEVLGHDGSDIGITTYAYFNTETGVGFVLLINSNAIEKFAMNIGGRLMEIFDTGREAAAAAAGNATGVRRRRARRGARVGGNPGANYPKGCGL